MSAVTLLRSRAYREARPFSVTTEDGARLAGSRVGPAGPALVFAHGFLGWHRKHRIVRFVEVLAERFRVYAVDLRGHGRSSGVCTYGNLEVLDVEAVVRLARRETDGPVATMGASMGGISVLRHAALRGGVDAVVAVSAPAGWDGHRSRTVQQMRWLVTSAGGRRVARALGVRLGDDVLRPETPEEVVGRIAPTPVILIHGVDDHVFDVDEARRLYARAGEPKTLLLGSRFGHSEDGFSPAFARLVGDRILPALALDDP
jgi:pimeloyl-ACP methyl ester carboxylesterase